MNQDVFHQWFEHAFVKQTNDLPRPILLIIDGHTSHFSVPTLRLALEKNMYVVKFL